MLNVRAYQNYFGGKSGNGTYQAIINHIPPHDVFCSLFLGNCGITRKIRPAAYSILNDLDFEVFKEWSKLNLPANYFLTNLPALEILKDIQSKSRYQLGKRVFIYLDPPYRKDARKNKADVYRHEMSDSDHSDLLSQIVAMPDQMICISHYPDPVYEEMLAGWHTYDFYSMIRNGLVLERIYYNYDLGDALHDYCYIGDNFREREANNRIKKNFLKKLKRLDPQLRNSIIQDLLAL